MRRIRSYIKVGTWRRLVAMVCASALLLVCPEEGKGYSVMSHQAIIDAAWENDLKPALRKRFPTATEDELNEGQAYAYGGAIIQDLGYYPYGSPFFSDLTHYVRSADFILAMLRDAQDVNEYAFALGAMAHYAADNNGHKIGTNRSVPILYPKLKKKYGDSVSYRARTDSQQGGCFPNVVAHVAQYELTISFFDPSEPLTRQQSHRVRAD